MPNRLVDLLLTGLQQPGCLLWVGKDLMRVTREAERAG